VKSHQLYFLSLLTGLLLTFAWFPHGLIPLIFIGFVPLLIIEKTIASNPYKYHSLLLFLCTYSAFLVWNILTTWWVKNASLGGAALAILSNSLLMTMVFILFHNVKKRIGEKWQYFLFISFWITWEFFHLHWDLSWPWLTLGNVFADTREWVQWYEYTGVFGGGLWILIINSLIASCFTIDNLKLNFKITRNKKLVLVGILVIPILISFLITANYKQQTDKKKQYPIVIVQPNIDPYNEKFTGSPIEQLNKMLQLAAQKTDSTTEYLIFPETALVEEIWEQELEQSSSIQLLRKFLKNYPNLKIIIGASTAKVYAAGETRSATSRKFTNDDGYYDSYNTALQLDNNGSIQVYHKSKLVPGVEKLPFPIIFQYLGDVAIDLGGTSGSLGMQEERTAFTAPNRNFKVAPVICYESIYGEYVGEYINNGANFIAIITNDGWWGDTPGYKQHLKYGALRAIETRQWIARSANTGTSCFITPMGEIEQATHWWVPAVIAGKIEMSTTPTFYTRCGDYIARTAMILSLLLIIYSWSIRFRIIKK
jgi:apolipoprotein N-acyltransferase